MRFIVDAQLPPILAKILRDKGHEAFAVRELGLRDADDGLIWARAEADGASVITKDEDYAQRASSLKPGPAVVWIRCGNLVRRVFLTRFEAAWPEIERHLESGVRVVEMR